MIWGIIGTAFLQGFLGSLHCVGMCGPFVYIFNAQKSGSGFLRNAVYNLSRSVSYTIVGVILGSIGFGLNTFFLSDLAAIIGGGLIILFAFSYILPGQFGKLLSGTLPSGIYRGISGVLKKFENKTLLAMVLGLISGLLPCGLLYPAFALAILTGSPLYGGLVMLAFSFATYPTLFALGLLSQTILTKLQNFRYRIVLGTVLLLLGMYTISHRSQINFAEGDDCHTEETPQTTSPAVTQPSTAPKE